MARTRRARNEPPECHPDRPHQARGLCAQCYMREYDKARKGRAERRKDPEDYSPNFRKPPFKPKRNADCHPDRPHASLGLCKSCYEAKRREEAPPSICHPGRPAVAKGMCVACYSRGAYWKDPEKAKEYARRSQAATRKRLRGQMIEAYGGRCACPKCPETNSDFLTLDHVNGDGKQHRQVKGSHTYADLRKQGWPQDGYRLLCWNCNAMTRGGRVCPHMK